MIETKYDKYTYNDWDFDKDSEQVGEFVQRMRERLNETEQRMLLCLIDCEEGLISLKNQLYK